MKGEDFVILMDVLGVRDAAFFLLGALIGVLLGIVVASL